MRSYVHAAHGHKYRFGTIYEVLEVQQRGQHDTRSPEVLVSALCCAVSLRNMAWARVSNTVYHNSVDS